MEFERLVDLYYDKGNFDYYRQIHQHPEEYFLSLPDIPAAHSDIGRHFELIVAENCVIAPQYEHRTDLEFCLGPTEYDDPECCSVSEHMCLDFPIMRLSSALLLTDEAFNIVAPYVDWDFCVTTSQPLAKGP